MTTRSVKLAGAWTAGALGVFWLAACSDGDKRHAASAATPTFSTATATQTAVPASTITARPTSTFTTIATPTSTSAPSPSATPTETASVTSTATSTSTPTATPETCEDPEVQGREPLCELDRATTTCDFLIAAKCLLPFPSSVFLRADGSTPTGFRLAYEREAMPANKDGVRVDPTEWNTLDGFSPGPLIVAFFPQGVDLVASDVAPVTDLARSLESDSPTVLLDAETGERVVHFAELDAQASGPGAQTFLIRPAVRLNDGRRYIVAIRGLVDRAGDPVEPERPFVILRDGLTTPVRAINERRPELEDIFSILALDGVDRESLILAWDFVTASTQSLTRRALALRDRGLQANGPGAPAFTIDSVEENVNEDTLRRVRGRFIVPLFMTSATPPARLNLDALGLPTQSASATAPFIVNIPRSTVDGGVAHPARPIVYGHGLLGSGDEINSGHLQDFDNQYNFIAGATDWIGMSGEDLPSILAFTSDVSGFPILPDRLQQAMLNFILLGRLMIAPDGFASDPAFQLDGEPLIDTQQLYFYGISQGGIAGGVYMALATDSVRGVLGVGAANYSILLQRSVDFSTFQAAAEQNYTDELDFQLLLGLIQQLWDRADPQAYLPYIVENPLPGTPAKKVLMQIGINDSQVSNLGSAYQARSMGIPNLAPSVLPLFGVPEMTAPFDGSAFVPYDVNGLASPLTNTPPAIENGVHEAVRRLDAARRQVDAFLRPDGRVENFCEGPCFFTGVPNVEER